jgi:hypothetical protein
MFVKVDVDKLVMNTKYKIEAENRSWVGYYKRTRESVEFVYRGTMYEVLPHRSFYQFVSDNPRWNMERRTVNLIVRQLTGDDCFQW